VTAIQIHRRGVDDRAARGDGRDCAASFCLFCRVFVCFAARCCRCSSEEQSWSGGTGWVLRGCSGVLLGYYRGTTGVLLQSLQSGRTIIDPTYCELEKGSTSYCGQRHGIAVRLLGVALLSNAPVSTRKVFQVHLVAPNQAVVIPRQVTMDNTNKSMPRPNWLSTRPTQHGRDLAGRT
jgi:hypothetical protein